jgi:hypothetical protein
MTTAPAEVVSRPPGGARPPRIAPGPLPGTGRGFLGSAAPTRQRCRVGDFMEV